MKAAYLALILLTGLTACQNLPTQTANLLPSKDGKDRYSVSGVVMVGEVTDDVTKPFVEQGMQYLCPNGLIYERYREDISRKVPLSTWVQWHGVVVCR